MASIHQQMITNQEYLAAAYRGDLEEMQWCLSFGADPYVKDDGTVLQKVSQSALLPNGYCPQLLSFLSGRSALHLAICTGKKDNEPVIEELLAKYPELADQRDNRGETPFIYFLTGVYISQRIFNAFLLAQPKFDCANLDNVTPLYMISGRKDWVPYLEQLISTGLEVKKAVLSFFKEKIVKEVVEIINSYLTPGFDPKFFNLQTVEKWTPLHRAIGCGNHKAVKILRTKTDLSLKDQSGESLKRALKKYDRKFNTTDVCPIQ